MAGNIVYIIGVSGSGKTTIGKMLSQKTGIPFYDADDYHSTSNIHKMKRGEPLTDEDRKGWLDSINQLAREQADLNGAIIACSGLKETYRRVLCEGITEPVHWVFLQGDHALIAGRMKERKDHFMPPALLQSQFDTLEVPSYAITVDISGGEEEVVEVVVKGLTVSGLRFNV